MPTPGYRDWRGSIETAGQFNLADKWVWGWDGTLLSDKNYLYDYGMLTNVQTSNLLDVRSRPTTRLSQLYLAGRGDRSYFDARTMYFYGFSTVDMQSQIPVIHPVIDYDYVVRESDLRRRIELSQQSDQPVPRHRQFRCRSRRRRSTAACAL